MPEELIRAVERKDELGKLTDYERKAYEGAKDMGWFNPERVCWWCKTLVEGSYLVRRGYYVATRLYDKGYFEHRLVGEYPYLDFEFRYIAREAPS